MGKIRACQYLAHKIMFLRETVSGFDKCGRFDVKPQPVATPKGPFYRVLGLKIEEARHRAKLTQDGLARALGLSRTSVTNIEKGRQPVQAHVLARLAEVLNTSIVALMPQRGDVEEPAVKAKLAKYSVPAQAWAKRVIATYSVEEGYGSTKDTSKKESKRPASGGEGKDATRAR